MTINEFLEQSIKKQFQELQVTEYKTTDVEIKVLNDQLKKYIATDETSYEVKGKLNNKSVKLNTNYLDDEILDLLKLKSENIESAYDDILMKQSDIDISPTTKEYLLNSKKEIEKIIALNNLRGKYPKIELLEMIFQYTKTEKRIINTHNVDIQTSTRLFSFNVEATAKEKEKTYNFNNTLYTSVRKKLDFEKLVTQAMEQAEIALNQEKLETGKYNVILSTDFMSSILKEFSYLLSKEQIRKQLSCLENKFNSKIFSSKVTIIEDAPNKNYPGYNEFDDEGTQTVKKAIVEKGILKTYLYNNKEAALDNCQSTGNGYGQISSSNLYLKPGKNSIEDLLQKLGTGLYIMSYLESGGTILNPSNGEISVQAFGLIVSDSKIKNGFESCILSTNIFELLNNIKEIGNEMEFKKNDTASPAILVENMSIASN